MNYSLVLAWEEIVAHFEAHFLSIFATSKKVPQPAHFTLPGELTLFQAHFDSVPAEYRVVDGARSRWWPLLVMDAAIHLLDSNTWCFSSRRAFNQHKALFDAILVVLAEQDEVFYNALASGQHAGLLDGPGDENGWTAALACSQALPLQLSPLPAPWQTSDQLKDYLMSDTPSKSKLKFMLIIEYFHKHDLFTCSLQEVLRLLVVKVIVFFACGRYTDDSTSRLRVYRPLNRKRRHDEISENDEMRTSMSYEDLSVPDVFEEIFADDSTTTMSPMTSSSASSLAFCSCAECSRSSCHLTCSAHHLTPTHGLVHRLPFLSPTRDTDRVYGLPLTKQIASDRT